jgi:hypothetical protein
MTYNARQKIENILFIEKEFTERLQHWVPLHCGKCACNKLLLRIHSHLEEEIRRVLCRNTAIDAENIGREEGPP